ncbi:hypothetical protein MSLAZ_3085 [Methanosarcina lacustris Z-7289]|uniref:Uncharacterized protein n=1 Tax=Methanosarcina lacustris Z-7289 TaxID=1434111 RepID=A0A0E3S757_9EURY|nr:hypothetical protein MSLAZ_3085 [Methanosarcina lacustris Z-7289]
MPLSKFCNQGICIHSKHLNITVQTTSDIRSTATFAINADTKIKLLPENTENTENKKQLSKLYGDIIKQCSVENI